jgi:polyisoprenoid-binding protein YceI
MAGAIMSSTLSTALPAVGTWVFDPSHSSVEFIARHLMISKVRGGFSTFEGTVTVAVPIEESRVEVTIATGSFTSGDENRDAHVRGEDFLDVERFPVITFTGSGPRREGSGWVLPGELTIRDVTRPVELQVEALGVLSDPWGNEKAAFSASTEIDREEFGITWNAALEAGGVLVGSKVRVEIDVQLGREG